MADNHDENNIISNNSDVDQFSITENNIKGILNF